MSTSGCQVAFIGGLRGSSEVVFLGGGFGYEVAFRGVLRGLSEVRRVSPSSSLTGTGCLAGLKEIIPKELATNVKSRLVNPDMHI